MAFTAFCTRRLRSDLVIIILITTMVQVHGVKLLDLSICSPEHTLVVGHIPRYACGDPVSAKLLMMLRHIHVVWRSLWLLEGAEQFLVVCVATVSWLAVAVGSLYISAIRGFYDSRPRAVLLVSTKFASKFASMAALALWRDAPSSTFCKWYLPLDGVVLLWQALVAPVGATAQAIIAAADTACTFFCCWLLSDRWPYTSVSTGMLLATQLLSAFISLLVAERVELADQRDFAAEAVVRRRRQRQHRSDASRSPDRSKSPGKDSPGKSKAGYDDDEEEDGEGEEQQEEEEEEEELERADSDKDEALGPEEEEDEQEAQVLAAAGLEEEEKGEGMVHKGGGFKATAAHDGTVLPGSGASWCTSSCGGACGNGRTAAGEICAAAAGTTAASGAGSSTVGVGCGLSSANAPLPAGLCRLAGLVEAPLPLLHQQCTCSMDSRSRFLQVHDGCGGAEAGVTGVGGSDRCGDMSSPSPSPDPGPGLEAVAPQIATVSAPLAANGGSSSISRISDGSSVAPSPASVTANATAAAATAAAMASACSGTSSPGVLSTSRSLSRALPSFSNLSTSSGYYGGSASTLLADSGGGGGSSIASRPSSCVVPQHWRPNAHQQHPTRRPSAAAAVAATTMAAMTATAAAAAVPVAAATGLGASGGAEGPAGWLPSSNRAAAVMLSAGGSQATSSPPPASQTVAEEQVVVSANDQALMVSTALQAGPHEVTAAAAAGAGQRWFQRPRQELAPASRVGEAIRGASGELRRQRRQAGEDEGNPPAGAAEAAPGEVSVPSKPPSASSSSPPVGALRQLQRLVQSLMASGEGSGAQAAATAGSVSLGSKRGRVGVSRGDTSRSRSPCRSSAPAACPYQPSAQEQGHPSADRASGSTASSSATTVGGPVSTSGPAASSGGAAGSLGAWSVGSGRIDGGGGVDSASLPLRTTVTALLASADAALMAQSTPDPGGLVDPCGRQAHVLGCQALSADHVTNAVSTRKPGHPGYETPRTLKALAPPLAVAAAVGAAAAGMAAGAGEAGAEAPATTASCDKQVGTATRWQDAAAVAAAADATAALGAAGGGAGSGGVGQRTLAPLGGDGAAVAEEAAVGSAAARVPRYFALARSLAARGGVNAVYDNPVLTHMRCSIKLAGMAPADLQNGLASQVASLLAAGYGPAAAMAAGAPGASLAAVGVYIREGCVEVVADVLVPSNGPAAEALVAAAVAATLPAAARDDRRRSSAGGDAADAPPQLPPPASLAQSTVAPSPAAMATQLGDPEAARRQAAPRQAEHAAAEAMLSFLERSLLPQITDALPQPQPQPGGSDGLQAVGLQATFGRVQLAAAGVMAGTGRLTMAAAPAQPAAAERPPQPTIICVTPCCLSLVQPGDDDTRDCRRQTVTLTVALAGGVRPDGRTPRVLVRHSGRCLAAVVQPAPSLFAGSVAVTVQISLVGVRPGLLFLEAAAPRSAAGGGGTLSAPWPVLVVGDARVAAEVAQLQQPLLLAAPLRAMQAAMAEAQAQAAQGQQSSLALQQQLQQLQHHQIDGGTLALITDLGMWFEAVSMPDAAVIAAATAAAAEADSDAASSVAATPVPPRALEGGAASGRRGSAVTGPARPGFRELLSALPAPRAWEGAPAAADEDASGEDRLVEEPREAEEGEDDDDDDGNDDSSWESSSASDHGDQAVGLGLGSESSASASRPWQEAQPQPRHRQQRAQRLQLRPPEEPLGLRSPRAGPWAAEPYGNAGGVGTAGGGGGGDDDGDVGEAQLALLRGLQPQQELLEGSLDCAVEYERMCRQGSALQSAASTLGMRLLRFTVTRGWPAAATLILKGLLVHCRFTFTDVLELFPAGGGMPLLHAAVLSGRLSMVRAVMSWAQRCHTRLQWDEPAAAAAGGLTPLHLAAVLEDSGRLAGAILGLWPEAEAHWALVRDSDGRTPLEYAYMRAIGSLASATGSKAGGPLPAVAAAGAAAGAGAACMALSTSNAPARPPTQQGPPAAAVAPAAAQLQEQQRQQRLPQPCRQERVEEARPVLPPSLTVAGAEGGAAAAAVMGPPTPSAVPQQAVAAAVTEPFCTTAALLAATSDRGNLWQAAQQPPQPQQMLLQLASPTPAGVDTGCGGVLGRPEGPPSGVSSMLTGSGVPAISYQGLVFRLDRTSDCSSMSVGPDSQWSHSTNVTAQTYHNFQHMATMQELRGISSPTGPHAVALTVMSLSNLPDSSIESARMTGAGAAGCLASDPCSQGPSPLPPHAATARSLPVAAPGGGAQPVPHGQLPERRMRAQFSQELSRHKPQPIFRQSFHQAPVAVASAGVALTGVASASASDAGCGAVSSARPAVAAAAVGAGPNLVGARVGQVQGQAQAAQYYRSPSGQQYGQHSHQQHPHPYPQHQSQAHPGQGGSSPAVNNPTHSAIAAATAPPSAGAGESGAPRGSASEIGCVTPGHSWYEEEEGWQRRAPRGSALVYAQQPGAAALAPAAIAAYPSGSPGLAAAAAGRFQQPAVPRRPSSSRFSCMPPSLASASSSADTDPVPVLVPVLVPVDGSAHDGGAARAGPNPGRTRARYDTLRIGNPATLETPEGELVAAAVAPGSRGVGVAALAAAAGEPSGRPGLGGSDLAGFQPARPVPQSPRQQLTAVSPPAGVRILANAMLRPDGPTPLARSPAVGGGGSASPASTAAAAAAGSSSYNLTSTPTSASSTVSGSTSSASATAGSWATAASARRRWSSDGRFSANTRRFAYADDYAPICLPTVASRTAVLGQLLPLATTVGAAATAAAASPQAVMATAPLVAVAGPSASGSGASASAGGGVKRPNSAGRAQSRQLRQRCRVLEVEYAGVEAGVHDSAVERESSTVGAEEGAAEEGGAEGHLGGDAHPVAARGPQKLQRLFGAEAAGTAPPLPQAACYAGPPGDAATAAADAAAAAPAHLLSAGTRLKFVRDSNSPRRHPDTTGIATATTAVTASTHATAISVPTATAPVAAAAKPCTAKPRHRGDHAVVYTKGAAAVSPQGKAAGGDLPDRPLAERLQLLFVLLILLGALMLPVVFELCWSPQVAAAAPPAGAP